MHERLKAIRQSLGLTQTEFGAQIGSTQNAITGYETGRRAPSKAAINNICKTFNVNEEWLRTGEGEMFDPEPKTVLDELKATMGLSDFEIKFLDAYLKLDRKSRDTVWQFLTQVTNSANAVEMAEGKKEPALPEAEAGEEIYTGLAVAKGGKQSAIFQVAKREAEELYRREVERSNRTAASGVEGDDL